VFTKFHLLPNPANSMESKNSRHITQFHFNIISSYKTSARILPLRLPNKYFVLISHFPNV
jgi:hypothetical protein